MTEIPIQPIAFAALTRTDFVRYAGASGDFNPLHHDAEFARAAGLPDVMGHGMLSAGLLATAVTRWFGSGNLLRYSVRFQSPVWPGDRLVATGRIAGVAAGPGGSRIADVELTLSRGADDVVVSGSARVTLDGAGAGGGEGQ